MKSTIGNVIKNCEICLRLKYDRQPPKIPYQTPETPSAPLEIVHVDIHIYNQWEV